VNEREKGGRGGGDGGGRGWGWEGVGGMLPGRPAGPFKERYENAMKRLTMPKRCVTSEDEETVGGPSQYFLRR